MKYHVEVSPATPFNWTQYATTTDTFVTMTVAVNYEYVVRVQAEDANGILGPWSEVSDPDIVHASPGACGKPFHD